MQIQFIGHGIQGFGTITDYALRYSRMMSDEAKRRAKILLFWENHGLKATIEAFEVSRRTLYNWKAQRKEGDGKLESLNPKSRRPKNVRTRKWPKEVVEEIITLRTNHPNLGKEKVHIFLKQFCLKKGLVCPSVRTIGRIISDAPDKMRTFPVKVRHNGEIVKRKRKKKSRKPKGFIAKYPGHCGSFDSIEKHINGTRRYIITFTDVYSRFSFAWATTSHASQAAKEVFEMVHMVFPYKLNYVLTDNGSEFMKEFDKEIRKQCKEHWHTYPRCPKMNPHIERFNRTLQEEFADYNIEKLMFPNNFNKYLVDYLIWYNIDRPHWSLDLKSPVQYLQENNPPECNMSWAYTFTLQNCFS